jgi:hypothetical protein
MEAGSRNYSSLTCKVDFSKVPPSMATRDPVRVDAELVALVRGRTRAAQEAEVRAALAPLTPTEEKALRKALRAGAGAELGPFGWADVARGVAVEVAAAREVAGYYALRAERDALAAIVGGGAAKRKGKGNAKGEGEGEGKGKAGVEGKVDVDVDGDGDVAGDERPKRRRNSPRRAAQAASGQHAGKLLGLFAYHRDAPLVARALRISLADLNEELDRLKIRRQAFRLTRGTDHDLPAAAPVEGVKSGPPVRRRPKAAPQRAPEPPRSEKELQAEALKTLLSEVGPRRSLLAARLGAAGAPLSDAALLARFRAAGLERELSLRERDLIRALFAKLRASEERVAAELAITPADLRRIVSDRGLSRELTGLRGRLRREALRKKWPGERIEQVLHKRDELRELGILDELDREVAARAGVIWATLKGRKDAFELMAKKLHLTNEDASSLQSLLKLR